MKVGGSCTKLLLLVQDFQYIVIDTAHEMRLDFQEYFVRSLEKEHR